MSEKDQERLKEEFNCALAAEQEFQRGYELGLKQGYKKGLAVASAKEELLGWGSKG